MKSYYGDNSLKLIMFSFLSSFVHTFLDSAFACKPWHELVCVIVCVVTRWSYVVLSRNMLRHLMMLVRYVFFSDRFAHFINVSLDVWSHLVIWSALKYSKFSGSIKKKTTCGGKTAPGHCTISRTQVKKTLNTAPPIHNGTIVHMRTTTTGARP